MVFLKNNKFEDNNNGLENGLGLPPISVILFILIEALLVIGPSFLYLTKTINEIILLFFFSVVSGLAGVAIFYIAYKESSNPGLSQTGAWMTIDVDDNVRQMIQAVRNAQGGSKYSRFQLRQRLRQIMLGKVSRRHGVPVDKLKVMSVSELETLVGNREITEFMLRQEQLPEATRMNRKGPDNEWKELQIILQQVKAYE